MTQEHDVFGASAAYQTYVAKIKGGQTSPSMKWLSKFASIAREQLQELLPRCNGCVTPEDSPLTLPVVILRYDWFGDIIYTCTQLGDAFVQYYPEMAMIHPAEHCSFIDNEMSPKKSHLVFYEVIVSIHAVHRETNAATIFYLRPARVLVYADRRIALVP
jgi:hypothetical protein